MIRPEKKLTKILKKHSGRDNTGKISIRHRGGRHKRYYRVIDFKRDKLGETGTVVGIEYDPNRNADIAKIEYKNKEKRYILHPKGLNVGDKILYWLNAEIKVGNTLPVGNIPIGIEIKNIIKWLGICGIIIFAIIPINIRLVIIANNPIIVPILFFILILSCNKSKFLKILQILILLTKLTLVLYLLILKLLILKLL